MRTISPFLAILAGCAPAAGAHQHDSMLAALRRDESTRPPSADDPSITTASALDRDALIDAVVARNPDADAARAAWRAAIAEFPATTALDDPMVTYDVAPLTVASSDRVGQRIELSQKLPWPGKRAAAGDAALAEADAAGADYAATRNDLADAASELYDDYYVNARALEVNAHHEELLAAIEKSATAQYTIGHGSEQDPLEVDESLIDLQRERLMLVTERETIVARINGLLHRDAGAELPPPPATLEVATESAAPDTNPKTAAAQARVRAASVEVEVARKAFYPDVELSTSYDAMWDLPAQRWMIGVAIELPLQRGKRRAAIEEARAEQAKAEAELAGVEDSVDVDVATARAELDGAKQTLTLCEHQLVPTAKQRVDVALAGYTSGTNDLQVALMAEHGLRDAELEVEEARADVDRKQAALARALGVSR
jgi:outer membrane protein TolC